MNTLPISRWVALALFLVTTSVVLLAGTNCDAGAGPLRTDQPQGITSQEIIHKFAANELIFKEAREHYTYNLDVSIQELEGTTVEGEFRLIADVVFDDKGRRLENVLYAPQPTFQRISLTREDYDDIRNRLPFVLTTPELPQYDLLYVGQQHVDELDTYVYDMAPKKIEKEHRYFQGRIWVDNRDLQIVKTCGKTVPDVTMSNTKPKKRKSVDENITPKFVTYRELIDGQYWFPTYTMADEVLGFATGDVHIKEVIKYTHYKRVDAKSMTLKGEAPAEKPEKKKKP
ncbi:MAG TPA: hypothetical protein VEW69_00915 [Alphaproteobacteria bacterium]|nr:hypothetical protein [Alphaproteobacteria bacterium]